VVASGFAAATDHADVTSFAALDEKRFHTRRLNGRRTHSMLTTTSYDISIAGTRLAVQGPFLKIARLRDEWHEDVARPEELVHALAAESKGVDLFTFWQRFPDTKPQHPYYRESDYLAVLPVRTYEYWLKHQLNNKTRNVLAKGRKKSLLVRRVAFDDDFVRGMAAIFNETPVRQGRRFWHYGKSAEVIKSEFSRYLFREEVFGAYVGDEMIGFMFIVNAGKFAMLGQILSMVKHRDKAPNNALIAKAVEHCAERNIPALIYAMWPREGSLRDFKKHNGFKCIELPRYYIPLSAKGRLALRLKLHREPAALLPESTVQSLDRWRSRLSALWYRSA
jgi:hypothetical protein